MNKLSKILSALMVAIVATASMGHAELTVPSVTSMVTTTEGIYSAIFPIVIAVVSFGIFIAAVKFLKKK